MMKRLTLVCLAVVCASTIAVAQSGRAQRGFTFAQTNCSQCHAIGRVGESPLPEAPPFRTLHTRYPVEDLAEAFAEGITTGHPSMPQFQLDPAQINDLLAYLNSIQG
jgi:cytochrome c